jgi:uncharacterized protein with HEPN domain
MPRSSRLYLQDIIDSAQYISDALSGTTFSEFSNNRVLQAAIERFIEIIGEAAKHLPAEIKSQYVGDWHLAARMRDVLAHDYPSIVASIVWDAATSGVPELFALAKRILTELDEPA